MYVCVYMHAGQTHQIPESGVTNGYEPSYGYWELNSGCL